MYKQYTTYDKALYVGTSALDLIELCMMKFHYDAIVKQFGDTAELIYSDTDSLIYNIKHDVYEWVNKNRHHFDLSNFLRRRANILLSSALIRHCLFCMWSHVCIL